MSDDGSSPSPSPSPARKGKKGKRSVKRERSSSGSESSAASRSASPSASPASRRSNTGSGSESSRTPSPKVRRSRSRRSSRSSRRRSSRDRDSRSRSPVWSGGREPAYGYSRRGPPFGGGFGRAGPEAPPNRCLGVFGLSLYTSERDLEEFFARWGRIERVQLVLDHPSGRSRGFGFVYFDKLEEAVAAKEAAPGTEIDGHRIRVDYSATARPHSPTPGVYMGNPGGQRSSGRYGGGGRDDYRGRGSRDYEDDYRGGRRRYGYDALSPRGSPSRRRRSSRSYSRSPIRGGDPRRIQDDYY